MTEQEFLAWYDSKDENKEELPEHILREILWGGIGEIIATTNGENRRWTRTNTTYFRVEGRYFALEWEEGLTEYQSNEYYEMPYEVAKHEYEKTITVVEWEKI